MDFQDSIKTQVTVTNDWRLFILLALPGSICLRPFLPDLIQAPFQFGKQLPYQESVFPLQGLAIGHADQLNQGGITDLVHLTKIPEPLGITQALAAHPFGTGACHAESLFSSSGHIAPVTQNTG
jgi:hypothetical protein